MLKRDIEEDILSFCNQNSIGVVFIAQCKRILTGKMTRERIASFPADDHRRNDPEFNEPLISYNLEFVNQLIPIAKT